MYIQIPPTNHTELMAFSCTIILTTLLLHFSHTTGARITFVNNCSETIWPAILDKHTRLSSTGVQLSKGNKFTLETSKGWIGSFWGKTGCTIQASCNTGDCDHNHQVAGCSVTGVTVVEFNLAGWKDYYDVSLVYGFNLPLLVEPRGGSADPGQCAPTGCLHDLNRHCPPELRTKAGTCQSACRAFNTSEECCTGEYNSPATCRPSKYTQVFKEACPQALAYPYDDLSSTFTCTAADYFITFCPANDSFLSPLQTPAPNARDYLPTKNGSNAGAKKIIFIVLGVTSLVIASIAVYFLVKRQQSSGPNKKCKEDIERFLVQHGSLAPKRYRYSEIKKITKSFKDKLGQGGYGSVYKGKLPDGSLVAVKVLMETDSKGEEFINEVASISRTSHVNIVGLLGFCYEGDKKALVYEYMSNKSLDKFLSKFRAAEETNCAILDMQKLYKIAVGIAKGLEYLHTGCNTRIVHFDIKPQNILLDEDLCPKISDFGLAKLCKKRQSVLSVFGARGTIGYIAPEMFSRNFGGVSHKSDVYSYGMMVLEMAGARDRFEEEVNQSSSESYFPDKLYERVTIDITNKLDDFKVDEEDEETRKKMFLIGFWCIQMNPSERPSMSKVVEMFEGSLKSIQIPPKPAFQFSPDISGQEFSTSLYSAYVDTQNSAQD